jgi:hypothetical protein
MSRAFSIHGLANGAIEHPASPPRPWQAAQGKTDAPDGPGPNPRPPLIGGGVRRTDLIHD